LEGILNWREQANALIQVGLKVKSTVPAVLWATRNKVQIPGVGPKVQGDASHPHITDVRRGPDGHGVNAVKCSTCHQEHNLPGVHMPPGAPEWSLPSPAMPMIWEGLSDHQLCELLKDPKQNGHRTVEQIVEHMRTPLVLWGWDPGEGRTPIPYPRERFLEAVKVWADHGAACPAERARS
jgi:hypothetical protein